MSEHQKMCDNKKRAMKQKKIVKKEHKVNLLSM